MSERIDDIVNRMQAKRLSRKTLTLKKLKRTIKETSKKVLPPPELHNEVMEIIRRSHKDNNLDVILNEKVIGIMLEEIRRLDASRKDIEKEVIAEKIKLKNDQQEFYKIRRAFKQKTLKVLNDLSTGWIQMQKMIDKLEK